MCRSQEILVFPIEFDLRCTSYNGKNMVNYGKYQHMRLGSQKNLPVQAQNELSGRISLLPTAIPSSPE
jgi:hypothetical protein